MFAFEDWECVSAPKGVFGGTKYHRAEVKTREEAIGLIAAFALLGITKEN
jgi:hypothetical protein